MVMKVSITFISQAPVLQKVDSAIQRLNNRGQDIFSLTEGQKVMGILSNKFIGYKLV